jgi:protein-S-isoprenylcysteine O-methyltransferase Ste14
MVDRYVIPREERYLRAKFGDEYAAYTQRVRRWL